MNLLITSTVSCILEYVAPIIIKYIITYLYVRRKVDTELRNDLISLKHEMAEVSMVDEFSKYAKLQRKYNKLENILRNKVNERLSSSMKVQLFATYTFRILNSILILTLLCLYKNEAVVVLPKGILWPIQNFLSWPSTHEDSISLVVWLIITRLVISSCKKMDF